MKKTTTDDKGKTKAQPAKIVRLQISPDDYAFATRFAELNQYFGAEDFLNGVLNMALIEFRDHIEDPESANGERKELQRIIDRQGAQLDLLKDLVREVLAPKVIQDLRHEFEMRGFPPVRDIDLDEEIPF